MRRARRAGARLTFSAEWMGRRGSLQRPAPRPRTGQELPSRRAAWIPQALQSSRLTSSGAPPSTIRTANPGRYGLRPGSRPR